MASIAESLRKVNNLKDAFDSIAQIKANQEEKDRKQKLLSALQGTVSGINGSTAVGQSPNINPFQQQTKESVVGGDLFGKNPQSGLTAKDPESYRKMAGQKIWDLIQQGLSGGSDIQEVSPYANIAGNYAESQSPTAQTEKKPIEIGGVLLDPETYQPLFDSRTEKKKDSGFERTDIFNVNGKPIIRGLIKGTVTEENPKGEWIDLGEDYRKETGSGDGNGTGGVTPLSIAEMLASADRSIGIIKNIREDYKNKEYNPKKITETKETQKVKNSKPLIKLVKALDIQNAVDDISTQMKSGNKQSVQELIDAVIKANNYGENERQALSKYFTYFGM